MPAVSEQSVVCPVRQFGTRCKRCHGKHVYQCHDNGKNWKAEPTVGDDFINLVGNRHAGSVFLLVACLDYGCDVNVSFVGDNALCIVIQFFLCCHNVFLDVIDRFLGKV